MIITKTPFRMSFFGGGTDVEDYFKEHKGAVISTTFDKYCYVNVRHLPKFFDYNNQIAYSKIERVKTVDEIVHPAVRNAMKMLNMEDLIVSYDADLPARTGLGTSSSFAVGMLNAFYALDGKYVSKKKLADDAIYLERILCNEAGGWQDQVAAAFGGFNRIDFDAEGFRVTPLIISKERKQTLNDNLMMFFTGFTRMSSEIQKVNAQKREKERYLMQMYELVDEAESILVDKDRDIDDFGRLLGKNWELKRMTGDAVSTSSIDSFYQRGIAEGALGGKLLGAGGGGFLLFYVRKENQVAFKEAMKDLLFIPFKFENSGTEVIYYNPEEYLKN